MFSKRIFEAAVDTSVIGFRNGTNEDRFFSVYNDLENRRIELNQDTFEELPYSLFPVNLDVISKSLVDKLLNCDCKHLVSVLEVQQGIIYSGLPKEKVFAEAKKNSCYKKVLDGRDILKWYVNWDNKHTNKYIWYTSKLHRPREERLFLAKEKILLPRKATSISCTIDTKQYYALNTAYICLTKDTNVDIYYILACLNSKLINYFYRQLFFGWQITIPALNALPIKNIKKQDQLAIADKAKTILEITADGSHLTDQSKQNSIEQHESAIDQMIYEHYNLTPEEIAIVEGVNGGNDEK